jgi:hypothetical protein
MEVNKVSNGISTMYILVCIEKHSQDRYGGRDIYSALTIYGELIIPGDFEGYPGNSFLGRVMLEM